jgi:hypothetical protein
VGGVEDGEGGEVVDIGEKAVMVGVIFILYRYCVSTLATTRFSTHSIKRHDEHQHQLSSPFLCLSPKIPLPTLTISLPAHPERNLEIRRRRHTHAENQFPLHAPPPSPCISSACLPIVRFFGLHRESRHRRSGSANRRTYAMQFFHRGVQRSVPNFH